MTESIEVFISFAREDEDLRDQLLTHLRVMERNSVINIWHSGMIKPGEEFEKERDKRLGKAGIVLLLVSQYYVASDDCYNIEMMRAMDRYYDENIHIILILLRPFEWKRTKFAKLRVLPMNEVPITSWPKQDEALLHIAEQIAKVVENLLRFNQTDHNAEEVIDSNSLFNTLIRLDFSEQVKVFQQFKNSKHRIGAFLIHGAPSYGQSWLLNRLIKQLPGSSVAIDFKFSFERKACGRSLKDLWMELAKWVGLKNQFHPSSTSTFQDIQLDIIRRVYGLWQRQSVFLILNKLHEIDEEYLNKFIESFWKPLTMMAQIMLSHSQTQVRSSNHFLILFLIDSADTVQKWKLPTSNQTDSQWEPHIPIKLEKLSQFHREVIHNWLEYEIDTLPAILTDQNILENSENGIPEFVLDHICAMFGYEWSDFIKYRI